MAHSEQRVLTEADAVGTIGIIAPAPFVDIEAIRTVQPWSLTLPLWLRKLLTALLGVFVFIVALELLKYGASAYGSALLRFLNIANPTNALGLGWLMSYGFLSGSPVAAISVSFFSSGAISDLQTFTMITGSRMGASFIVLFVGFVYALRGYRHTASIAVGILAFLTTAAIHIPALPVGAWLLMSGFLDSIQTSAATEMTSFFDVLIAPVLHLITAVLPDWAVLIAGVLVLLMSFSLLDRALPEVHSEHNAFGRIGKLVYRPAAMLLLGAAITSMTLSVSVSLAILVPLSARGLVRRENMLPYIMGANITTFVDTLIAALIVGGPAAFTIVLVEMISVTILSLLVLLLWYRRFERSILGLQAWIIRDNRMLIIFLVVVFIVPITLLLVK